VSEKTQRIPEWAGFCSPGKLPKGPRGFNLCRKCGNECQFARLTFCSHECVHEWKLLTQPGYQASEVLKRDRGVCALCSRDTQAERARIEALVALARSVVCRVEATTLGAEAIELAVSLGQLTRHDAGMWREQPLRILWDSPAGKRRPWDMDHVVPVVEGGGSCGLDNLRTLCRPCHKRVTAELAARRAAARKSSS
jgi:5-methylcytosine-specific restriction enzyme A